MSTRSGRGRQIAARGLRVLGGCAGVLALVACSGPRPVPASTNAAPPPRAAALTAHALFCAYGGVGIVPDPLPPGYDAVLAEQAFEIENPGAALVGVTVTRAALLDSAGTALASMRHVVHAVVLPQLEMPSPSLGSFGVYLNPDGTPFDGTLPTGRTQLRVRYALDHDPGAFPARCRLELDVAAGAPLVVEGGVDGVWPTS